MCLEKITVNQLVKKLTVFMEYKSYNWTPSGSSPNLHTLSRQDPFQYLPPTHAHVSKMNSSLKVL